ncbi:helix-turn-helix domain-containing protein [Mesorhizobium sp. NZP2298]|uniref:helix-turn-helix domain-containing protein n=1 Tax=Mesorhizobium sp. NZP2298 TaxID=2483403 RepID=UPI00155656EE|nr:LexA family transcriptional regulator [Mesorhizobium sp. NZP2298]QKC99217.1 XRE family transcriptional regulator [Mesorhizobium sp. NZP2298]
MDAVEDTVGSRIRAARKAKGLTQKQLAKQIPTDESSISRWERDEQGITLDNAVALAGVLGVSVQYLQTGDEVVPVGNKNMRLIRVVGEVQAGVWREAIEWAPDDQDEIPVITPPEYRNLVMSAYVVRGPSMNMYYPSGTHVIVASTIANGISPKNGSKVLVSRLNKDGLYEATLKEYVIDKDGKVWLWPRSTDPQFQEPIAYKNGDTEEVTITGIVALSQITESLF